MEMASSGYIKQPSPLCCCYGGSCVQPSTPYCSIPTGIEYRVSAPNTPLTPLMASCSLLDHVKQPLIDTRVLRVTLRMVGALSQSSCTSIRPCHQAVQHHLSFITPFRVPLAPQWPRQLNREGKQRGFQEWERGWGWGRSRGGEALQAAQPAQPVGGAGKQEGTSARSTDSVSLYSMDDSVSLVEFTFHIFLIPTWIKKAKPKGL